jgi:hypothetical protein
MAVSAGGFGENIAGQTTQTVKGEFKTSSKLDREAREAKATAAKPTVKNLREGVQNVVGALQGRNEPRSRPPARPPKTKPEPAPSPAQQTSKRARAKTAEKATGQADQRGFVRPQQGTGAGDGFRRGKSARLGAFDPRQRTQGEKRRASASLNAPGQTTHNIAGPTAVQAPSSTNTLPSQGFNPKQFEEDQRLLGASGIG